MSAIIPVVAGNNAPDFTFTLERSSNNPISLTTVSTVRLIIKDNQTGVITQANGVCSIVSAANGTISYSPSATDFPNEGRYIGDIKLTYISGRVEILDEQVVFPARIRNS